MFTSQSWAVTSGIVCVCRLLLFVFLTDTFVEVHTIWLLFSKARSLSCRVHACQ